MVGSGVFRQVWKGAKLSVKKVSDLVQLDRGYVFVNFNTKNREVLEMIMCQNPEVDTTRWVIHTRIPKKDTNGETLILGVDAEGRKTVESMAGKLYLNFLVVDRSL